MTEVAGFRLSPQQRRLWGLPDGPAWHAQAVLRIDGALDEAALERAVAAWVERHEILRTAFVREPGIRFPLQSVFDPPAPAWTRLDLSGQEPEARLAALLAAAPSVDSGGSWRLEPVLARFGADCHALAVNLPALCADGRTLQLLPTELGRLYRLCREGGSELEEPVQYVQFSEWLHELEGDPEAEPGRRHWQQAGGMTDVALPGERETGGNAFQPESVALAVDPGLVRAIDAAAESCGVPAEPFLLAAWRALLWRLTAEPDLAVGFLADGRRYDELAEVHGLCARFVPVRAACGDDTPFAELARRIHERIEKGRPWQEMFAWPEPAGDAPGFFATTFEYEAAPEPVEAAGLRLSLLRSRTCFERFKVGLVCRRSGTGLAAELRYDAGLLSAADAERIGEGFLALAAGAAARPETPIGSLDILSAAERRTLIEERNATAAPLPLDRPVHSLFAEQARRMPEAPALVASGMTLTYGELDVRANRLAHRLVALGVGPDVRVAICCERSSEMVVGLLAILKAGGAYVPVDPGYPEERIAWVLADSDAAVVLAQPELRGRLPVNGVPVVSLGEETGGPDNDPSVPDDPGLRVDPDNLAYVIYTSGSTGRPKGVMVTHRGLTNYLLWSVAAYGLAAGDAVPVHSPLGFDLTVTSLWGPLLAGGKVWLLGEEEGLEELAGHLSAGEEPALVKLTPSHLEVLRELWPAGGRGRGARVIVLGGEALAGSSLAGWGERLAGTRIVNEYGPTETVVGCCVHEVIGGGELPAGPVPIGRPIANLRLYAVNPHLSAVPAGVPGELLIGGAGVARGYLGRPDLTVESFVPDPFGAPGSRLYRSGDRVRSRPDGTLEYLGRIDDQIKIRGFRIEPGEIETALRAHAGVADAAVVAREDEPDRRRLVAYLIPAEGAAPVAAELRSFLSRTLPEHMVPATFVPLRAWPLTPNGKLDRRSLPRPEGEPGNSLHGSAPPRTPEERILAEIWSEVLGRERVGVHDNFFEMGGDSILGVQAVARAQRSGLRLTPGQLFRYQTVAELAAMAEWTERAEAPAAEQGSVLGPVPLTPIQRWFFALGLARPGHWNQAVLLEVRRPVEEAHLRAALESLLAHHDALRLRFRREAGGWVQDNAAAGGPVPLVWRDLSGLPAGEQSAAVEAETARLQTSLDLAEGPLLRAAGFDLGAERPARLLLVAHHLSVDAVSWRILLEDLEQALEDAARGAAVSLPPKTTSYRDWALHLERIAAGEELRAEMDVWLRAGSTVALPVDGPGGPNDRASEESVERVLDAGDTEALLQVLPQVARAQAHEVLLGALALAFARWTGETGLRVQLEGHGREDLGGGIDLSRTVGWFTSLYPAELRVEPDASPGEALRAAKEQLRRLPRHGVGFGILRHLGEPAVQAALAALPHPRIGFNYLGRLDRGLAESSRFAPAAESAGPLHDPAGERPLALEIAAAVLDGRLQVRCRYSRNLHRRETVESLADHLMESLRELIAHGRSPDSDGLAPSDFPKARLSEADLRRVAELLEEIDTVPRSGLG